jgi:hypothetical protein
LFAQLAGTWPAGGSRRHPDQGEDKLDRPHRRRVGEAVAGNGRQAGWSAGEAMGRELHLAQARLILPLCERASIQNIAKLDTWSALLRSQD